MPPLIYSSSLTLLLKIPNTDPCKGDWAWCWRSQWFVSDAGDWNNDKVALRFWECTDGGWVSLDPQREKRQDVQKRHSARTSSASTVSAFNDPSLQRRKGKKAHLDTKTNSLKRDRFERLVRIIFKKSVRLTTSSLLLGTLQMQLVPKLVSLVWMQRRQHRFS